MIKNYLKTAWRNLKASKFYTLINMSGLAIGLATAIMLLLWVRHELSYDRFHQDYRNIYLLSAHFMSGDKETSWSGVPGALSVFAKSIPQVRSLVRISEDEGQVLADGDRRKLIDGNHTAFVDSTFFSIFDFPLLRGHRQQLFPNSHSAVISRSLAVKIFNSVDVLGKLILFRKEHFTITGVMEDFPENSSLQLDALFPMSLYAQQFTANGGNGDWKTIDEDLGNYAFKTYVKLQASTDPAAAARDFTAAYKKARNGDSKTKFTLQNLAGIHLTAIDGNDAALKMVHIFLLVAILLLAIAAINYVNLSTARSLIRAREVGIRKIIGATKFQLFFQFVTETLLLFAVATAIAIGLIFLLMPLYNRISGKALHFSLADAQMWKVIGVSILGTLAASSIYPALVLSSFRPAQSIKGRAAVGMSAGLFRKILVVFQFTISVCLIISTLVISRQMAYVRQMDLGYDKNYVFTVPLSHEVVNHIDAVKNELKKETGVVGVSLSNIYDMSNFGNATGDLNWEGKPEGRSQIIGQALVDEDFIPTMGIQLLEGGNFSGSPADSNHYIVNEAAVKAMGLKPPYVGQPITFHERPGVIIGVMKDFNFQPLKEKITPILFFTRWKGNILFIRTTAKDAQQAIAAAERQYKKYAGDLPFSYSFLDKQFEEKYRADQRAGMLFKLFALIAIFISCLGLLGLATYMAQVRTKEIGVRKVLGASIANVVNLLGKDFILLVALAILLAVPAAWYGMNKWLEDFAYRITIRWWMFALAGLLAILIAMATISYQAIKAAVANPVNALRNE